MSRVTVAVLLVLIQGAALSPLGVVTPEEQVINYLTRYGYLAEAKSYNENQIDEGLRNLQKFFNLPETGVADKATLELMKKPRCGFPDILNNNTRFVIGSPGFNKKHLTYFIEKYSPKLPNEEVDKSVKLAMELWTTPANLTFSELQNTKANIRFSFEPKVHGDGFPFDGPHGRLAHAFYRGAVHFDAEENWKSLSKPTPGQTDFFTVALHELGHSLGLAHSKVGAAVMYPTYHYIDESRGLHDDDRQGIIAIYVHGGKP